MLYHFFSRYISLTIGWLLAKNRQVLQVFFSFSQPLAKNEVSFFQSVTAAVTIQLDFCVKIYHNILNIETHKKLQNWPSHLESSNGLFLQFLNESSKEKKRRLEVFPGLSVKASTAIHPMREWNENDLAHSSEKEKIWRGQCSQDVSP